MKNDEGGVPRRKIEEESDKGTTLWKIDKLEGCGNWKKKRKKKKKVDARKGKRRWDVTGWRKKSRESFGGVSRHVVELLFG